MTSKARTAGTRDEHYNLISVLYHALHGAQNCDAYALDAEAVGKDDLTTFFRNVQAEYRQVAEQAKVRLGIRGIATLGTAEVGTEIPPEGIVGPEAPPALQSLEASPTSGSRFHRCRLRWARASGDPSCNTR